MNRLIPLVLVAPLTMAGLCPPPPPLDTQAMIEAVTPGDALIPGEALFVQGAGFLPGTITSSITDLSGTVVAIPNVVTVMETEVVLEVVGLSTPRAPFIVNLFRDGVRIPPNNASPQRTVMLRSNGSEPAGQSIRVQYVIFGKSYAWNTPEVPNGWRVNWAHLESYDLGTYFPMTTGDNLWSLMWQISFWGQQNQSARDWRTVCGRPWQQNGDPPIVRGITEPYPYVSLMWPSYFDLEVSYDSHYVYSLSRGLMYEPAVAGYAVFPGTHGVHGFPPCDTVWPRGTQGCQDFVGTRDDAVVVALVRTFKEQGIEVDPNDVDSGYRAVATPVNEWHGGFIDGLILISGSPCLGCTPSPTAPPGGNPARPANQFEVDPNRPESPRLFAHELGHALAGLADAEAQSTEPQNYNLMVSSPDNPWPRGYYFDSLAPAANQFENCTTTLNGYNGHDYVR